MAKQRNWYSISNKAGDVPELYIYDEIGYWGISALDMIEALKNIDAPRIKVRIHSPGGYVSEGVAIFNALRKHPAQIDVEIDSLAASIATVIAMAGDTISMASNALFMIHNPWAWAEGDANDLRKQADVMDKFKDTIVTSYAERTGIEAAALEAMMDDETWFTADEALEAGFIDTIEEANPQDASNAFSNKIMNNFRNPPEAASRLFKAKKKTHSDGSDYREQGKGEVMNKKELIAALKEVGVDVPTLETEAQASVTAKADLATAKTQLATLNALIGERSHDEVTAALEAADKHRDEVVVSIVASRRLLKQVGDDDEAVAAAKASYKGIPLAQLEALAEPLQAAAAGQPEFGHDAVDAQDTEENPYYKKKGA